MTSTTGRESALDKLKSHIKIAPREGWFTCLELHITDCEELMAYIIDLEQKISESANETEILRKQLSASKERLAPCENCGRESEGLVIQGFVGFGITEYVVCKRCKNRKLYADWPKIKAVCPECEELKQKLSAAEAEIKSEREGAIQYLKYFNTLPEDALITLPKKEYESEKEAAFNAGREQYVCRPKTIWEVKDWKYVDYNHYQQSKGKP